jgi:hypothetical protein
MSRYKEFYIAIGMCILFLAGVVQAEDLGWECISKEIGYVTCVLISSNNRSVIYMGTEKGIFKTNDGGDSWQMVLKVKGYNPKVNLLFEDNQGLVYAATGEGLFLSRNQGISWQRLFRGKDAKENDCQDAIVLSNGGIYLGTEACLFVSKDKARTWQKSSGRLKDRAIVAFAYDKYNDIIYVAAEDGIYKINKGQDSYERIFLSPVSQIEEKPEEDINEGEGVSINDCVIRYIEIELNSPEKIYLATNRGVYKSKDFGSTWEAMPEFGLLSKEIKFLRVSKTSYIYAVTKSGIFVYKKERWEELSLRLPVTEIHSVAFDNQDNLYACTAKGLFKATQQDGLELNKIKEENYFKDEPTVQQLHQAAMEYAGVIDPKRIEDHRRKARIKAVLPELTLDYEKTISTYTSVNSTRFSVGPWDWGVTLNWNLSDLIWSEQQRLIDSQVRLMVQLRNDILDEVNKLYFERRRLKMELLSANLDSKKRMEKELKLEELTASLDALTGGYFSKSLKEK